MDPLTIAVGVKGVADYFEAENQAKWTEYRFLQNRVNAAVARDLKIQSLNRRAIQEAEATAGQKFDLAIASMEAREARVVAAGEAGLGGKSIDAQSNMVTARQLRGETVLNDNLRMTLDQIEDEKEGFNTEMMNRINSLPRGQKPNMLMHALNTAANMYATEAAMTGKSPFSTSVASKGSVVKTPTLAKSTASTPLPASNQNALFFMRNF
jgi:hypothetical protein